jgi:hypothetical protein
MDRRYEKTGACEHFTEGVLFRVCFAACSYCAPVTLRPIHARFTAAAEWFIASLFRFPALRPTVPAFYIMREEL